MILNEIQGISTKIFKKPTFSFWAYCSGLLLRSREEEICILYEKINVQEFLCRKGDIEMQAMDEKISFLKMKVAEKERQIKFWLKALPMKRALDAELVILQIQVGEKEAPFFPFCFL